MSPSSELVTRQDVERRCRTWFISLLRNLCHSWRDMQFTCRTVNMGPDWFGYMSDVTRNYLLAVACLRCTRGATLAESYGILHFSRLHKRIAIYVRGHIWYTMNAIRAMQNVLRIYDFNIIHMLYKLTFRLVVVKQQLSQMHAIQM